MRIEKVSEKQIRCTLSHDDLSVRHLNISELAYGSEKARSLFREMLTKASREFGFQAENMPLMIEAVPLSEDSIMLLITKVEDPEEIDTRFAKFAPTNQDDISIREEGDFDLYEDCPTGADDVIKEFSKLCQDSMVLLDDTDQEEELQEPDFYQVFCFSSIDEICCAAKAVGRAYSECNTLYKDPDSHKYYLVLHKGDQTPENFNKVCNILCEYGTHPRTNAGSEAHYDEHFELILAKHALQSLALL